MAQDNGLNPPDLTASGETAVVQLDESELDTRQLRGFKLWKMAAKDPELTIKVSEATTVWRSTTDRTRAYQVTREERNRRGSLVLEYRCQCPDYLKNGRIDCLHIFAERLRRLEVRVEEAQPYTPRARVDAEEPRHPKRVRNVRGSLKNVQRKARVKMPSRVPELIASLKRASHDFLDPDSPTGSNAAHADPYTRAAALLLKVASGKSADEMISVYERFIDCGLLQLRRAPHQNTLSRWSNDAKITPILEQMLEMTALPFRRVETAAIVDSSKLSQMRTAHSRLVEYGRDERDTADWMKSHVIVGLESMVCMSARFSGSIGPGSHDINHLLPLVQSALKTFRLKLILADKAYLAEDRVGILKTWGISAYIPVRKRMEAREGSPYFEAISELIQLFDKRQSEFQGGYRFRVKIESFFALLKKVADGYCWSRGRPPIGAAGPSSNAEQPCVAWINEALCKIIYANLRTTVHYELKTGYTIDYATDRFFRAIPKDKRLVA